MRIQAGQGRPTVGGPNQDGKYAGWIMGPADRWDPILSTDAIYDSAEEARDAMERLIEDIRAAEPFSGQLEAALRRATP